MFTALSMLRRLACLPYRLAWRGYGVLWWAFAEDESAQRVWSVPPRRMRLCWWLSIAIATFAGAGAFLLTHRGMISGTHAAMGVAWTVALGAVGSAFFGTRVTRRADQGRKARSVESTLEAASRLIQEGVRGGQRGTGDAPGSRPSQPTWTGAWTGMRTGGRTVAGIVTAAARSGWAGVRHAAATYRQLRVGSRPSGV